MKIYIDEHYNCHVSPKAGRREQETDFFPKNACQELIEGYSCLPPGESWQRSDGRCFEGLMIWPHTDYAILQAYQYMADKATANNSGGQGERA